MAYAGALQSRMMHPERIERKQSVGELLGCRVLSCLVSPLPAMSAVQQLNPNAEVARAAQALLVNISAARGLMEVLRSNIGPKGTMKMCVHASASLERPADAYARVCFMLQARERLWRHQDHQGRKRAAARDADSAPDGVPDRPRFNSPGRHHRRRDHVHRARHWRAAQAG
jgi:hypothetical protein